MIQVQRFNKALKLAVILGDLVILNVLFISFNSIWNELFGERAYSGTLPQILTLFSVCYLRALSQEVSYYIDEEPVPIKLYSGHSVTFLFLLIVNKLNCTIRT